MSKVSFLKWSSPVKFKKQIYEAHVENVELISDHKQGFRITKST